jgi:hypothetical protein
LRRVVARIRSQFQESKRLIEIIFHQSETELELTPRITPGRSPSKTLQ